MKFVYCLCFLAVVCCVTAAPAPTEAQAQKIAEISCSKDGGLKAKVKACETQLPKRILDMSKSMKAAVAPGISDDDFQTKLCSQDKDLEGKLIEFAKKQTQPQPQLSPADKKQLDGYMDCMVKLVS